MQPKYKRLCEDIMFEIGQIDVVVEKINKLKTDVTETNIAATGTFLMNFYNGIENIMKRCAKEYYKNMPVGGNWHKELLMQSCKSSSMKIALFKKETVDNLYDYLSFRHFFIHGYGFKLKWDKMKLLVDNIDKLWGEINAQIKYFVDTIANQ